MPRHAPSVNTSIVKVLLRLVLYAFQNLYLVRAVGASTSLPRPGVAFTTPRPINVPLCRVLQAEKITMPPIGSRVIAVTSNRCALASIDPSSPKARAGFVVPVSDVIGGH